MGEGVSLQTRLPSPRPAPGEPGWDYHHPSILAVPVLPEYHHWSFRRHCPPSPNFVVPQQNILESYCYHVMCFLHPSESGLLSAASLELGSKSPSEVAHTKGFDGLPSPREAPGDQHCLHLEDPSLPVSWTKVPSCYSLLCLGFVWIQASYMKKGNFEELGWLPLLQIPVQVLKQKACNTMYIGFRFMKDL